MDRIQRIVRIMEDGQGSIRWAGMQWTSRRVVDVLEVRERGAQYGLDLDRRA